MLLDFSKAFDLVDHHVSQTSHLWHQHNCLELLYLLLIRTDSTSSNYVLSLKTPVSCTPGFYSWNIAFILIFINDLPHSIKLSSSFLFADDTTVLNCGPDEITINENLNTYLKNVSEWGEYKLYDSKLQKDQIYDYMRLVKNSKSRLSYYWTQWQFSRVLIVVIFLGLHLISISNGTTKQPIFLT